MKIILLILALAAVIVIAAAIILNQKQFGRAPGGARLERILKSPHYRDGRFQNLTATPQLAEDTSMPEVMFRFLFGKTARKTPEKPFHFTKTDLKQIPAGENVYVWMGHSSYFIQIDSKKILVDPVFSGYASPFSFTTNAFKGTDLYSAEDIPALDYLVITHDHWDHLDYSTVRQLFPKVKNIITGLGTGEHLEYWGYDPKRIIELDWSESADLGEGFRVTAEPARHFSGRGLKRDQAIWASFVFESPQHKILLGGDSGYGSHFANMGEKYGSIDLAILENGQYNKDWRYIHMMPGEQLQAMKDLHAKRMIPVHNAKFALAVHAWDEPMRELNRLNTEHRRIICPAPGEKTYYLDDTKTYTGWWEKYR